MKSKKNYYLSLGAVILIFCVCGFQMAEDPMFLAKLKESLMRYNSNYPEEKVYVQFDKTFYKPGEDIWFNAFILNSNTLKPTMTSDVVYVELVDPKGNVAKRLDLAVREGTTHGDFALQAEWPGGIYKVRAYTNWMKNFGDENIFRKDIQVQRIITPRLLLKLDYEKETYGAGQPVKARLSVHNLKNESVSQAGLSFSVMVDGRRIVTSELRTDTQGDADILFNLPDSLKSADGLLTILVKTAGVEESISRSIPIVLNKINIQFLPEGGTWMEGVTSRVAFKAVNEFGKGADVAGSIVDENNNVITRFESFHMGMGAFRIKPSRGSKYFARIETPAGNASVISLPEFRSSGFVMNVDSQLDFRLTWSIHSTMKSSGFLVGQSHGEIVWSKEVSLTAGENLVSVPVIDFPAGIAVFTLFNGDGVEQCERLAFVNPNKRLTVQLKTNKKQYLPREQVKLEVKTLDHNGKPVPSRISLAVVDDQLISYADDKQDNILSSLLLSSELKGEVQEPAFYFDPKEPKAAEALDYLLMTQGWRRFNWKDVHQSDRPITYSPEKNRNLAGELVNRDGIGFSDEVTLLELGGQKRIVKVKSTDEGYFVFKNIDPTIPILLLAHKPGTLTLRKNPKGVIALNDKAGTVMVPEILEKQKPVPVTEEVHAETEGLTENELDLSLDSDVTALSEVVVTGFGTQEKKELMGSITTVQKSELGYLGAALSPENLLQGRVSGLYVTPPSGNPGAQANVVIRGYSSLANGRNEPLFVVDGHPIGSSLNHNFSNGSMIGVDEIESIEVIKSPEATALFGNAAANGVILITTRSGFGHKYFALKKKEAKYNSLTIQPRAFSPTREFYVPVPSIKNHKRKDFRTTIYWNHSVVTDEKGTASVSFYNSDAVSAFRVTAEGFSKTGLTGRSEEVYYTELPLALDVKLPQYLGYEDVLKLPVRVRNETSSLLSAALHISVPPGLDMGSPAEQKIQVPAKSTGTWWVTLTPKGIEGNFPVSIRIESDEFSDQVDHVISVKPAGFPERLSFSAKQLEKTVHFAIRDAEKNSIKAELTAFPDVLSDLFTGAESILQQPHGCFEQVSSSNYPNVLALQFMKQSGSESNATENRAVKFIMDGYRRLTAYEIGGGGFEWFGHPPAHEGLTAYGLIQFHEMKKVFDGVDEKMLNRTREWLLSRRDGRGGFRQTAGKYGFAGASQSVTNAYLTYALSETGTKDLLPEFAQAYDEVLKSGDMYRMALVASTAFNLGKLNDYENLVKIFTETAGPSGPGNLKAGHSIVQSYGNSLQIETLSLWVVTLLKSESHDRDLVQRCIGKILSGRAYGQFGSTQGTALALKALTEYAHVIRTTRDDGEINIMVDKTPVETLAYGKETRDKMTMNGFAKHLKSSGEQSLKIQFGETSEPLPYSVDIRWYTKKPAPSERCKVGLSTSLASGTTRLNETVRLTTKIKNKTNEGLPMVVAVIGIPAGLSPQPWQLKELQEKNVFDFYEITDGNLVLYYREMAPNGEYTVNLDLKAEIPGSYVGSASSAYLYYTNEYKDWVGGNSIVIQ